MRLVSTKHWIAFSLVISLAITGSGLCAQCFLVEHPCDAFSIAPNCHSKEQGDTDSHHDIVSESHKHEHNTPSQSGCEEDCNCSQGPELAFGLSKSTGTIQDSFSDYSTTLSLLYAPVTIESTSLHVKVEPDQIHHRDNLYFVLSNAAVFVLNSQFLI